MVRLDLRANGAAQQALRSADRAYLITTGEHGFAEEVAMARRVIEAASATRLDHIVLQSVTWADTRIPHCATKGQIERELSSTDLSWTSLRAGYFTETLPGYLTHEALRTRQLLSVIAPEAPVWWVGIDDLAEAAVSVLTQELAPIGVYDAVAREPMSFATLTRELSQRTRSQWTCRYVPIPTAKLLSTAVASGAIANESAQRWLQSADPQENDDYHAPISGAAIVPDPTHLEVVTGVRFRHPLEALPALIAGWQP